MISAITAGILRTDFLRRSSWEDGGPAGHREWLHFSIISPELTLLVNLSVVDDLRKPQVPGRERARVSVLIRQNGRWEGGADEVPPDRVSVCGGRILAAIGETNLDFHDGAFHLEGRLEKRAIAFSLVLCPLSFPAMASNVPLGAHEAPINWVVVPRLQADGWVRIDEQTHIIDGASAYHDHNWGHFAHRDLAWEWGHALPNDPTNPFTVVFTRLLNRGRTASFMDALLLWKGPRQYRVMRGDELSVETAGFLRESPFTIPQNARILANSIATDLPERLHFEARGAGDILRGTFVAADSARIVVPHEHDLDTTMIHEVAGAFELEGRVRGEAVAFEGRAVFEFLGSGP